MESAPNATWLKPSPINEKRFKTKVTPSKEEHKAIKTPQIIAYCTNGNEKYVFSVVKISDILIKISFMVYGIFLKALKGNGNLYKHFKSIFPWFRLFYCSARQKDCLFRFLNIHLLFQKSRCLKYAECVRHISGMRKCHEKSL